MFPFYFILFYFPDSIFLNNVEKDVAENVAGSDPEYMVSKLKTTAIQ